MGLAETGQLSLLNGLFQAFVLKFGHLAALSTYQVVMRTPVITFLVLRGIAKLVLDDQTGVNKQDDSVVERGTAYAEVLVVGHERIEGINVKMSVYGIYRIEYGVTFGRLAMSVRIKIFGEYLLDRIFHILTIHKTINYACGAHFHLYLQRAKLILFCGKQRRMKRFFFTRLLRPSPKGRADARPQKRNAPSLPPGDTPDKRDFHRAP